MLTVADYTAKDKEIFFKAFMSGWTCEYRVIWDAEEGIEGTVFSHEKHPYVYSDLAGGIPLGFKKAVEKTYSEFLKKMA